MAVKVHLTPTDAILILEADTVAKVNEAIKAEQADILELFSLCPWAQGEASAAVAAVEPEPKQQRKKRGQPDPATATAPPPMLVVPPAPPPPVAATPPAPVATPPAPPAPPTAAQAPVASPSATDLTIPTFLKRDAPAPVAVAPPPPPVAAPAAPQFNLGPKIAAEYEKRKAGSPDAGKGITEWMLAAMNAMPDFTIPGASFEEMLSVLRMTKDEKVAHIAEALGVK